MDWRKRLQEETIWAEALSGEDNHFRCVPVEFAEELVAEIERLSRPRTSSPRR